MFLYLSVLVVYFLAARRIVKLVVENAHVLRVVEVTAARLAAEAVLIVVDVVYMTCEVEGRRRTAKHLEEFVGIKLVKLYVFLMT